MTADYVRLVVPAMTEGGTLPLKHFPGYGNNADTHTGIAVDQRPDGDLWERRPALQGGIEAWTPFVLVATTSSTAWTRSGVPLPTVHKILRKNAALTASPSPTIWRWTP